MAILKIKDDNDKVYEIPAIKGDPGLSPHIGDNGNWFVGDTDTGVRASAEGAYPLSIGYSNGHMKQYNGSSESAFTIPTFFRDSYEPYITNAGIHIINYSADSNGDLHATYKFQQGEYCVIGNVMFISVNVAYYTDAGYPIATSNNFRFGISLPPLVGTGLEYAPSNTIFAVGSHTGLFTNAVSAIRYGDDTKICLLDDTVNNILVKNDSAPGTSWISLTGWVPLVAARGTNLNE